MHMDLQLGVLQEWLRMKMMTCLRQILLSMQLIQKHTALAPTQAATQWRKKHIQNDKHKLGHPLESLKDSLRDSLLSDVMSLHNERPRGSTNQWSGQIGHAPVKFNTGWPPGVWCGVVTLATPFEFERDCLFFWKMMSGSTSGFWERREEPTTVRFVSFVLGDGDDFPNDCCPTRKPDRLRALSSSDNVTSQHNIFLWRQMRISTTNDQ